MKQSALEESNNTSYSQLNFAFLKTSIFFPLQFLLPPEICLLFKVGYIQFTVLQVFSLISLLISTNLMH